VAVVGTLVGFAIFLTLLLFAAQVLVRLYATSVVDATATRAAESAAEAPNPAASEQSAEAWARSSLGSFAAQHVRFAWFEADAEQVVVRVDATAPALLPEPRVWRSISRTVTIRTERLR